MHLSDYVHHVVFRSHEPLKLPVSSEVAEIGGFGPPICMGGDNPDFGHTFSNRTHFRACGRFWLSSVQLARRVADEKEKRWRRITVIPKSADDYVGRPNYRKYESRCRLVEFDTQRDRTRARVCPFIGEWSSVPSARPLKFDFLFRSGVFWCAIIPTAAAVTVHGFFVQK